MLDMVQNLPKLIGWMNNQVYKAAEHKKCDSELLSSVLQEKAAGYIGSNYANCILKIKCKSVSVVSFLAPFLSKSWLLLGGQP